MFLDECHRYLSGDLENILAEARKYGIAAVLAHQWLEQLRSEGDNMLAAVQNATNVKLVFRIKDAREAEELAASVIPLDVEMPVRVLVKPTVVGHRRIRLANEGTSEERWWSQTTSETWGESETHSSTHGESDSETWSVGESIGESKAQSEGRGHSVGESAGTSQSRTLTNRSRSIPSS